MNFVTGATGLVGSHILVELSKLNEFTIALKRKSSDLSLIKDLFQFYFPNDWQQRFEKIKWIDGNISDIHFLIDSFKEVTHVYHCAAMVSFNKRDFNTMYNVNVVGTENIVNACLASGVKKLCFISSTAALGRTKNDGIITEQAEWKTSPENSYYAVTKNASELQVWRGIEEGLEAVIINPSIILGPCDWNKSSGKIFKKASKGVKYYTSGGNAFVDVRDVAKVSIQLAKSTVLSQRFLCFSENLSYRDLFDRIQQKFGHLKATKFASKFKTNLAWKVSAFLSWFGVEPFLTKETARTSQKINVYSNQKLVEAINYKFLSIDEAIENSVQFFKK